MARLREVFGAKSWIVAGDVAQGVSGAAIAAQSLGAERVIAIASRLGVGELTDDLRFFMSDDSRVGEDASMVERMHDSNRELHDLPAWVVAEVDERDPDRQAQVIVSFTVDDGLVADRPTFGARRSEWAALEDKIRIREIWQDANVVTAPDRVVATDDINALLAAHDELATRWGSVWAVDNDQGWHGGGLGTRWVSNHETARELAVELNERHRQVRVQPFLEGVPCGIHGMVLADATLAFRPCEMIVLLDAENETFEYSRSATFWDPNSADRSSMRSTARSIGDALRNKVDYRGVFTVDGVLTTNGFRPTEVNPRFGGALPQQLPTSDGSTLPMFLTHLAAVTGNLDDFDPHQLEALIVDRIDQNRAGGAFIPTKFGPGREQKQVGVTGTWTAAGVVDLRAVSEHETSATPFVTATWGDDPSGGLVLARFTDAMPTGPAVAPTVVALRRFLNSHWGLNLRELRPAFGE